MLPFYHTLVYMSSKKSIFLCRIDHCSPTVWVDVSRANCAILNVGDESCKCHPSLPLFLPLSPSFTSSFPILCCCHASHYIIYIDKSQALSPCFFNLFPFFLPVVVSPLIVSTYVDSGGHFLCQLSSPPLPAWFSYYNPAHKQPRRKATTHTTKALSPSLNFGGSPSSTYGSTIVVPFVQHKQYKRVQQPTRAATTETYRRQQSSEKCYLVSLSNS